MTKKYNAKSVYGLFASRRDVLRSAAAVSLAGMVTPLVGCQTLSSLPETPLSSLFIDDGNGPKSYISVLGGVTPPEFGDKGLPLPVFGIHVASVAKSAKWMLDYNFDGNNELSRAEMIQAWLVKTAEWKTGKTFAPNSLSAPAPTAGLQLAQTSLVSLQGININVDDEKSVRGVIDEIAGGANQNAAQAKQATAAQKAMVEMMTDVNKSFANTSSGGGDGGGGESSGGEDGGSSGTSGGSVGSGI